mmetsp:Transcript_96182/g.248706  ORF Transcript_96182/g.248706 Transcript_96182/m.248706 type:complete len:588 (-) Transcript_96182:9-1772(-)
MVDGVAEGEEGVGGDGNAIELANELGLLVGRQRCRLRVEVLHPLGLLRRLHVALDVAHAGVHAVLPLHALLELQLHDLGVEAQAPSRHLAAGELHAVHAALLPGADADHHALSGVADGVRLRVLDGDRRNDQVELRGLRQVLLVRHDLLQVCLGEDRVVALLHEAETAGDAVLHDRRLEVLVGLEDDELAALLGLQDLQRLGRVAGGDDAVADLDLEDVGGGHVDLVRDGHEVAEGAHRVRVARPDVGRRHRRQLLALHLVHHLLVVGQRQADRSAGGAAVLERGGGGLARRLAELVDQLPRIHGVQQVDVAWHAGQDLEGQLVAPHGAERGRQLMRVAAVLQRAVQLEGHGPGGRLLLDVVQHPCAHHGVVRRGQRVRRAGAALAEVHRGAAVVLLHVLDERAVLLRARDDGHEGVVLGRGTDHARAADVDVLNARGEVRGVLLHGLVEGVEVHDGQVDRPDAVLAHLVLVLVVAARGEQAAVDLRVQGLDAAVQDLRRAGVVRNVLDGAAELPELRRGAARGEHVHLVVREELAELLDARLVEDGDQGGLNLHLVLDLAGHRSDGGAAHGGKRRSAWGLSKRSEA